MLHVDSSQPLLHKVINIFCSHFEPPHPIRSVCPPVSKRAWPLRIHSVCRGSIPLVILFNDARPLVRSMRPRRVIQYFRRLSVQLSGEAFIVRFHQEMSLLDEWKQHVGKGRMTPTGWQPTGSSAQSLATGVGVGGAGGVRGASGARSDPDWT